MQNSKTCSIHNHPIDYVCFDKSCVQSSQQIMCKKCTEQHNLKFKEHRVVQYDLFKKYLETLKKEINYEELKQIIKEQFENLKSEATKYLSDLQDSILASLSLEFNEAHQFQIFQGQVSLVTKNNLFNKYIMNPSSISLIKQEQKSRNIFILKQLRNLNDQIKKVFQNVRKDIQLPHTYKKFSFSTKFKHQNIQVLNDGASVRRISKESLGHSQLAVCKQPFTPINNSIQFVIKDITVRACISVGACVLQTVQRNNFFRSWQLGEGTYSIFMNTMGVVKSNHNTNRTYSNAPIKLWKLKKGDLIKVQIDFMKEKIIFTKNNHDRFEMPIDIVAQKMYPFAALSYTEDSVQIK